VALHWTAATTVDVSAQYLRCLEQAIQDVVTDHWLAQAGLRWAVPGILFPGKTDLQVAAGNHLKELAALAQLNSKTIVQPVVSLHPFEKPQNFYLWLKRGERLLLLNIAQTVVDLKNTQAAQGTTGTESLVLRDSGMSEV